MFRFGSYSAPPVQRITWLTEHEHISIDELLALDPFINALFSSEAIDEVEPLAQSYRELATAFSRRTGLSFFELRSVCCSARLHEVLPRQSVGGGNSNAPIFALSTFKNRCLEGKLTFGDPFLDSDVVCICTPFWNHLRTSLPCADHRG